MYNPLTQQSTPTMHHRHFYKNLPSQKFTVGCEVMYHTGDDYMELARVLSEHHPIYIIELSNGKTLMTAAPLYAPVHTDLTTITEFYQTFIDTDNMRKAVESSRNDGTLDEIRRTLDYISPSHPLASTTKRLETQLDDIMDDINNSRYSTTPHDASTTPTDTPTETPLNDPPLPPPNSKLTLTGPTPTNNPIITPTMPRTNHSDSTTTTSLSSTSTGLPNNPMRPNSPEDWEALPATPIRRKTTRTPEELSQPTPKHKSPMSTWSDYDSTTVHSSPSRAKTHNRTTDSDSDDDDMDTHITESQRVRIRNSINMHRQFFLHDESSINDTSTATKPPLHPNTSNQSVPMTSLNIAEQHTSLAGT